MPNTKENNHTPWKYSPDCVANSARFIRNNAAEVVVYCDSDLKTAKANAALIVRAVNSHAALVAACEAALSFCTGPYGRGSGTNLQDTLAAALALAKEENT